MKTQSIGKHTIPKSDGYKPKRDRSFTFILISVIGFFLGFGLCIGLYSYTLINIFSLSKFIVLFAVIGFFIPLKFYIKWFHFGKYEMIIFNIIGVAPFFTGLFLFLNFTFTSNTYTQELRIDKIYFEGEGNQNSIGVILENNIFSDERKIVELTNISTSEILEKKFLKITLSEGIFGYKVIKEKVLID